MPEIGPKPESMRMNIDTDRVDPATVTIPKLSSRMEELNTLATRLLAEAFEGVPVRVDPALKGYDYYLMISPQLEEELKMAKGV